jgi:hypothetical protein
MLGLNDHADPSRGKLIDEPIGDLSRDPPLDLEVTREQVHNSA